MTFSVKFAFKLLAYFFLFSCVVALFYGAAAWFQARNDASELKSIAIEMQNAGLGAEELGVSENGDNRAKFIIMVEDPDFLNHSGIDFSTAGAGSTTITQSLSKRLAFEDFKPGYRKIRQTGYAIGLESTLTKDEIFTLFLNSVHMGRFPTGWIKGFHRASKLHFRKAASEISDEEFIELVSVMIAPGELRLDKPHAKRDERVERIQRLVKNECAPSNHGDIWLEGCAN